jgi:plastocyanin
MQTSACSHARVIRARQKLVQLDHLGKSLAFKNGNHYHYRTCPKEIPMHYLLLCLALLSSLAVAADLEYTLVIRDNRFEPAEIRIPAGKKIKLLVDNQDATAEEFESHELNREKIVPGKSKLPVFIGPLAPGRYPFFGDFHQKTATGVIIAE